MRQKWKLPFEKEETAIDVMIDPTFRETVSYYPKRDTQKTVVYFIGKAKNYDYIPQEEEISEILCMPARADSKAKQLMRRALENGGQRQRSKNYRDLPAYLQESIKITVCCSIICIIR